MHPHQVHQQHQTQRQQMRQRQQRQQLRQRQQHHTHCVEAFSPHGKARPGWKLLLVNIQLIQPKNIHLYLKPYQKLISNICLQLPFVIMASGNGRCFISGF